MVSKKKRSIVGYPLTPSVLDDLDAWGSMSSSHFSSIGHWTNVYRIWACHGYRESGNEDRGILKIERSPSSADNTFTLKVTQKIHNDSDLLHVLDAQIVCRNDTLATPVQWQTQSKFYDPMGVLIRDLETEESGRIRGNIVEIATNGKTRQFESSRPLTGDWCLLEAVQRMPWKSDVSITMDILKEMTLLQKDHHIIYHSKEAFTIGGKSIDLYHFQQVGRGILPYDYWLDSHHRLQVFVTLSIAYIRDERAEQER